MLIAVLCLKGATVLVESPCDWVILRLFEAADVRVIEWPLQASGALDLEQLRGALETEPVRLVLLSSGLSMPRGSQVPHGNRQSIAQLLARHDSWVLENDCYGDLGFEPDGPRFRDLLDPDRLIVFSTFEKIIGPEALTVICSHGNWVRNCSGIFCCALFVCRRSARKPSHVCTVMDVSTSIFRYCGACSRIARCR